MVPVTETNDIVSSGQTEVTSNVYIKVVGEWQPKRFMQSTSNELVIEAGNGIWSGTIRMQIPTSPTEAEFLGRSAAFGTETNTTILDGIVWDTTQMTANDYGKFSPTGVFISKNVKSRTAKLFWKWPIMESKHYQRSIACPRSNSN